MVDGQASVDLAQQPPGPPGWGPPQGGGWGPPPGGGWGPPQPPQGGWAPPPGSPPAGWGPPNAPPGGYPAAPGGPPGQSSSPMDALSFAWNRIKADPGTILGTLILGTLVGSAIQIVGDIVAKIVQVAARLPTPANPFDFDPAIAIIHAGAFLLNWPLSAFMQAGMMIFALKVARGDRYQIGDLFAGGRYFVSVLAGTAIMGLLVAVGIGCLVVPGVILSIGWFFAIPAIVDKDLGPIEALKESWRITDGKKGDVLLLLLGMALTVVAGLCACCLGALVAMPLCLIAQAYAYLRLTGQRTAAAYPGAS